MQTKRKKPSQPGRGKDHALRALPAVGSVLESAPFARLADEFGAGLVTGLLREEIGRLREAVRGGRIPAAALRKAGTAAELARAVGGEARRLLRPSPRVVINATGVVAHTNLGRSVLSEAAAARVARAASAYMDLEFDLERGVRGSRLAHLDPLLARLFPGYAATAVNNNAAAILLALRSLARGKEVVVSRGELVEIGGSFRVPEILAASGARLREVGTTNRTRTEDYAGAVGPRTGVLLKVHTSNFKIVGFTEEAPLEGLAAVARTAGVPLVVDWGSGDLVDLAPLGITDEIPVGKILERGADLVTFSGDKLLGGPQAGIAVGRAELVARMRRDPLARAIRLDRLQVAALRETLVSYVKGRAREEVPTLRMIGAEAEEIGRRAERLRRGLARLAAAAGVDLSVVDGVSRTGGGSSPLGERPTRLLAVADPKGDAGRIERALRTGDPAVLARLHEGRLLLDLRTVLSSQEEALAGRLADVLSRGATRRNGS
jgi:L-seryl-tRNA(Ser) seleniumtransferase